MLRFALDGKCSGSSEALGHYVSASANTYESVRIRKLCIRFLCLVDLTHTWPNLSDVYRESFLYCLHFIATLLLDLFVCLAQSRQSSVATITIRVPGLCASLCICIFISSQWLYSGVDRHSTPLPLYRAFGPSGHTTCSDSERAY